MEVKINKTLILIFVFILMSSVSVVNANDDLIMSSDVHSNETLELV